MKLYRFIDYTTQGYLALVMLLILLFHNASVPHWPWLAAAHAAAILLIHLLIHSNRRIRPLFGPILRFLRHFYPVLLYTGLYAETAWLNRMFFHTYLDPFVIRCDQALFGCQPSVVFMEKLPYLALSELFYAAYFSYYLMILGIGVALYLRSRPQFWHYVSVISFVFYVCYLVYIIFPVVGPPVFFHDCGNYTLPGQYLALAPAAYYPPSVQAGPCFKLMAFIYRIFEAPGAALPSSHVAIALSTVYFSFRYLRAIRYPHLVLAILLCLATIYCRYHYVTDVLTGALTAAILVPLGNKLFRHFDRPERTPHPQSQSAAPLEKRVNSPGHS